jgi:hypothetical protein
MASYVRRRTAIARSQVRADVELRSDPLFSQLDENGDGRLGAREIAAAGEVLRSLDRDGDEQIVADEIPAAVALRLSRGPAVGEMIDASVYASPPPSNLATPAWFNRMDANRDGEISPREFLGDAARFGRLDADGDGFFEVSEIVVSGEN